MIKDIVEEQRKFFMTGKTLDYKFRMKALSRLRRAILDNEEAIYEALAQDLNKSKVETYLCEIGIVLDEIRYHQKHLQRWMKNKLLSLRPDSFRVFAIVCLNLTA